MRKHHSAQILIVLVVAFLVSLTPGIVRAHCDTMNGPVVIAAQKALETGNVNLVLIWVQKEDEGEIKQAFNKTLSVRKLNPQAKELADMYFFETLVRVHRAGEGVAYTGLKPAETEVEPGIVATDKAIEKATAEEVMKHLNEAIHQNLHSQFTSVMEKKKFNADDVNAGREYVNTYVQFIHYVEGLFQAASKAGEHLHEPEKVGLGHEKH